MIVGAHAIFYAEDADAARAFLRDVLGFDGVDAGGGWLIFSLPPAEVAVHPAAGEAAGRHELFFMCHDMDDAVATLARKGVEVSAPITDEGWGLLTRFRIPGAGEIGLYQPKHPSPLAEFAGS